MSERPQNKHLKPFPKGVSGNPSGKPKGLLTKDKVDAIISKFSSMSRTELQSVIGNEKTPMIEIMIASVMVKAAKDGDYSRMDSLLNRVVGKVTDKSEIKMESKVSDEELDEIPREKLMTLLTGSD